MSKKILTITSLFVVAVVLMICAPARATLSIDVTFSAGAEPGDFNYLCLGACDPEQGVDTGTGTWEQVNTSGGGTLWGVGASFGLPAPTSASFSSLISGGTTVLSGFAEVRTNSPSGDLRDQAQMIGLPGIGFMVGFTGESIGWAHSHTQAANILGAVVNNDGQFHKIGWELDIPTKMAKAFFDGVQVGAAFDVSGEVPQYEADINLFGSGTSGVMNNTWTRVVIQEGAIPEPSSVILLGLGLLTLVGGCLWKKRRK